MPLFEVETLGGKTLVVETDDATPDALLRNASKQGLLSATEVHNIPGRDAHRAPVAVPFHAIELIRPKE